MRRLLDLRILRWQYKLAYVVGVYLIGFPIAGMLRWLQLPSVIVGLIAGSVVSLAGILLGARIFRGTGEPVVPPRPQWQMTARPRLSRSVGVSFATFGLLYVAVIVREALSHAGVERLLSSIDTFAFLLVVAVLYLNSAVRLKRLGIGPLEREFRPRAPVKLR